MAHTLFRTTVVVFGLLLWLVGPGQSFNVDIETGSGNPLLGGGAPSAGFAGAANQFGYWNPLGYGGSSQPVLGLSGEETSISLTSVATGGHGALAFAFAGNTGDYALLLNDAAVVAPLQPGGSIEYTFEGLASGEYVVTTYAVNVVGVSIDTPVFVPNSEEPSIQLVTGPMPGNSFKYLVTHSIHSVLVDKSASFSVVINQRPEMHTVMCVNGFQVTMVPEPSGVVYLITGICGLLALKMVNKAKN